MKKKIIIIDKMHPSIFPDLESEGIDFNYLPDISRDELKSIIQDYNGIIVRSKTNIDKEMLDLGINLKFIARAGAGTDKIDDAYCMEKGIEIFNAPEGNRDALGEHTIGILLALFNKIHTGDSEIRDGIWDREGNRGIEISGKVVGIIGYGFMGSAFAQRLSGFDCEVIAYDKYKDNYADENARAVDLDEIFKEADILSLHVPLSAETNGLYVPDFFMNFKKNIFLVNTSRGPVLPLSGLIQLLDTGKIMGAALDVLENEKLKSYNNTEKIVFNNLISRKNVVLTPHVGGWSFESYKRINDVLIQKIASFII